LLSAGVVEIVNGPVDQFGLAVVAARPFDIDFIDHVGLRPAEIVDEEISVSTGVGIESAFLLCAEFRADGCWVGFGRRRRRQILAFEVVLPDVPILDCVLCNDPSKDLDRVSLVIAAEISPETRLEDRPEYSVCRDGRKEEISFMPFSK